MAVAEKFCGGARDQVGMAESCNGSWERPCASCLQRILRLALGTDNIPSCIQNEKKKIIQQIAQEQISSEVKSHLKYFTKMQENSQVLQHASYTLLAGTSPQGKCESVGKAIRLGDGQAKSFIQKRRVGSEGPSWQLVGSKDSE